MVGTEMVTLVSSADILGLRTSIKLNKSVEHLFRWKGKGSIIVPWSWGTPQLREGSRRIVSWLLICYVQFEEDYFGQMVYRHPHPPPPHQAKIAYTPICTPLKRRCLSRPLRFLRRVWWTKGLVYAFGRKIEIFTILLLRAICAEKMCLVTFWSNN